MGTGQRLGRIFEAANLLPRSDGLLRLVDLAVQLRRSIQRLAMVIPLRNDLVDDLDRGTSSSLGLPASRSVIVDFAPTCMERPEGRAHLIFSGLPPRSAMKSLTSSIVDWNLIANVRDECFVFISVKVKSEAWETVTFCSNVVQELIK